MKLIRGQIFLTTGEVALNFGVTTRTILRWSTSESGDGPHLKPVKGPNKRLYFRKEEIDQLLDHYFGPVDPISAVNQAPHAHRHRRADSPHTASRVAVAR
jgi:hypothetical protein